MRIGLARRPWHYIDSSLSGGLPREPTMHDENREDLDLFEMANLYPATTGLPMTIWVSPRGHARHAARIKVCMTPGNRMDVANTASVRIVPSPRLMEGSLSTPDRVAVFEWIERNKDALIELWDGTIDIAGFVTRMVKV